ncbi:MAG: 50S ribosomal protein L25 [Deferrisomatales bacterium]|nr:50S ribosomal protein L25 [Deferrisomatales bacterium]
MHTEVDFAVEAKAAAGKGAARKLRAQGKIPGVVYGPTLEPVMVTFREQDLAKALSTPAQRNVFLRLRSPDQRIDGIRTIVKDLQVHPLKRVFVHADLYKLDADREIRATVPIRVVGTAAGVKLGGILQVARREVVVVCLPDRLPEALEVDVTHLMPGHSIHVSDLPVPEGVTVLTGSKLAVCAVIAPSSALEEAETGGAEAEPGAGSA